MMSGMYAAISGLDAHQQLLDVTANNLANVDTIGYKAQSLQFADELSQLIQAGTGPNGYSAGSNPVQVGLGVRVGSIDNNMTAGGVANTGNATDVAIQGDGFLQVANGNPTANTATVATNQAITATPQYTRAGDLTTNSQGFLCTQTGQYVLGYTANANGSINTSNGSNNAILIPQNATGIAIGQDGSVSYIDGNPADTTTYQQRVTAGYLSLATFPNEAGLNRDGGNLWSGTTSSGPATPGQPGTGNYGQTISGELEQSNVDMGTEFTNMIEAERGYQANASTITTADQMMQTVVQMKQ